MMAKYWNSPLGSLVDETVDRYVGEALQEYIVDHEAELLSIELGDGNEPVVMFATGPDFEFEHRKKLFDLLADELGRFRPGGFDYSDLFFKPNEDDERQVSLMQGLLRAYLDWKAKHLSAVNSA